VEFSVEEREQVAKDLRSAVAHSGLTQHEFAQLIGTSRPRLSAYLNARTMPSAALYQRILRTAAGLSSARRHGWMTPSRTAAQVNEALRSRDEDWAFKLVIQARDQLRAMLSASDPAADAWLLRSTAISDPRYDALLAALVQQEFEQSSHPLRPGWTDGPHLSSAWTQPNLRRGEKWTRQHTPPWLARRGIFIADLDLMTA
jgi:transcriptional regulator with XRE-family HTH domain